MNPSFPRRLWAKLTNRKPREKRMLIYLLILLAIAGWKLLPRPWFPTVKLETTHYLVLSTAPRIQTEDVARQMELLYAAYTNAFTHLPGLQPDHPRLKVKLFKDRKEFRWINPGLGWAEAFYRYPYCRAYYSSTEVNPYHWMIHEGAHQLNEEVAHLHLAKWLEEGLADYFGTSRLNTTNLALGRIDQYTYPVWWIDDLATTPNLAEDIKNGSVIPLQAIISNHGGPSMSTKFNLYYLHWWTLTHFLFESQKYHEQALKLTASGGQLEAFEQLIGPVEQIQAEWHAYVRELKKIISSTDPRFLRFGDTTPALTNKAAPVAP